jgi:hypothetical protein
MCVKKSTTKNVHTIKKYEEEKHLRKITKKRTHNKKYEEEKHFKK